MMSTYHIMYSSDVLVYSGKIHYQISNAALTAMATGDTRLTMSSLAVEGNNPQLRVRIGVDRGWGSLTPGSRQREPSNNTYSRFLVPQ